MSDNDKKTCKCKILISHHKYITKGKIDICKRCSLPLELFTCPRCGKKVHNLIIWCPKCKIFLPDFNCFAVESINTIEGENK